MSKIGQKALVVKHGQRGRGAAVRTTQVSRLMKATHSGYCSVDLGFQSYFILYSNTDLAQWRKSRPSSSKRLRGSSREATLCHEREVGHFEQIAHHESAECMSELHVPAASPADVFLVTTTMTQTMVRIPGVSCAGEARAR